MATHDNATSLSPKAGSRYESRPARPHLSIRRAARAALFVCALIFAAPVFAQEAPATIPVHNAASSDTRIEVDEEANVIRFFIDGQQAIQIDADGLHVRGDISNGGMTIDYGRIGFDRHVAESRGGADAQ